MINIQGRTIFGYVDTAYNLLIKWDDMSANDEINISHDVEFSNDGGTTWTTITAGDDKVIEKHATLSGNDFQYIIRTNEDITFFNTDYEGGFGECNFTGDMVVIGGATLTTGSQMFEALSSITTIDVSELDTSNMTSFYKMFGICKSITSLDLSNFDSSSVNTMEFMIAVCNNLESVNFSGFDFSNNKNFHYMFYNSYNLICITNLNTESSDANRSDIFALCTELTAPTSTEVTDLQDSNGANYNNSGDCPAI